MSDHWVELKSYVNIYGRSAGLISNPRANKKNKQKKKNLAHMVSLIVFERSGGGKKNLAHESDSVRTVWRWEKTKQNKKTSQERRVGCAHQT